MATKCVLNAMDLNLGFLERVLIIYFHTKANVNVI